MTTLNNMSANISAATPLSQSNHTCAKTALDFDKVVLENPDLDLEMLTRLPNYQ